MPSYFTCMSKYPLSFFQGGSCWMENLISYKSVAYSENVKALKCPIFHCVEHISCHYHLNIHENKFLYNRRETEQIMNLKSTQFILSNYVNLCSVSMLILCIDRQGVFLACSLVHCLQSKAFRFYNSNLANCFPIPFYTFQVVGESGLFTPDDVAYVQNAGVSAVSSADSL